MSRIRLCIISNTLDIGGAETQLLRLCRCIPPSVVDLTVVYFGGYHLLRSEYDKSPATIVFFDREKIGRVRLVCQLRSFLKNGCFDVVHCWRGTANQYGAVAAMLAGCRNIVTGHRNFAVESLFFRIADRMIRPSTVCRVVNSYAIKEKHGRTAWFPQDKIVVVHNGLDPAEFTNLPDPAEVRRSMGVLTDKRILITVGRLEPHKRQRMFIEVARRLTCRGFDLEYVIVGDGPDYVALRQCVERFGLDSRVHFVGRRFDVPALLSAASLCLCTSKREGLPNAVLEAMMAGTPVITTDNGGGPELVANDGQVADRDDVAELAEIVAHALSDHSLLKEWSRRGRERALTHFSIEASANRYLQVLHDIVNAKTEKLGIL